MYRHLRISWIERQYILCFKIAGPVWPRDSYGYICMNAGEGTDNHIPSYNAPQDCASYNDWGHERQWMPSYFQGQADVDSAAGRRHFPGI